jgi:DNA-binding CsgD family transcriptional regulator
MNRPLLTTSTSIADIDRFKLAARRGLETATKLPRQLAGAAVAPPAVSRVATAQPDPSRPIIMIMAFTLGGATDAGAQVLAEGLGALGLIPKSGQRELVRSAPELVFAGGTHIPPEILTRDEPSARQGDEKPPAANRPAVSPADLGLTQRQVDVLSLMMQGKSNKAICRVLDLAEPTVKNHVTAILRALKVSNRTEAVIAVGQRCWKSPAIPRL